jgi:hypothetical protein
MTPELLIKAMDAAKEMGLFKTAPVLNDELVKEIMDFAPKTTKAEVKKNPFLILRDEIIEKLTKNGITKVTFKGEEDIEITSLNLTQLQEVLKEKLGEEAKLVQDETKEVVEVVKEVAQEVVAAAPVDPAAPASTEAIVETVVETPTAKEVKTEIVEDVKETAAVETVEAVADKVIENVTDKVEEVKEVITPETTNETVVKEVAQEVVAAAPVDPAAPASTEAIPNPF